MKTRYESLSSYNLFVNSTAPDSQADSGSHHSRQPDSGSHHFRQPDSRSHHSRQPDSGSHHFRQPDSGSHHARHWVRSLQTAKMDCPHLKISRERNCFIKHKGFRGNITALIITDLGQLYHHLSGHITCEKPKRCSSILNLLILSPTACFIKIYYR